MNRVIELQEELAEVRKLPIGKYLRRRLQHAAEKTNTIVEVFSGGQRPEGPRTGSRRHDHGYAADVYIRNPKTKKLLDMTKKEDIPILQEFIFQCVLVGVNGVGAGVDYMGPNGFHIGGGTRACWGANGKSKNAPLWLKEAWIKGLEIRDRRKK